ncbi:D-2-hydroxyacid dehydrogenase [Candidatus Poribacteria bacterium]
MRVMINTALSDDQLRKIRGVSDELVVVVAGSRDDQFALVPDVEIVLGGMNRQLFLAAEKLKWVQVPSAGADGLMFPEFVESDVTLTSMKGYVGIHLADHAMALLLALARGIHTAIRNPSWDMRMGIREKSLELTGKIMGVIGLGGTGIEVARRAAGFGMEVIALEPEDIQKPDFVKDIWKAERFHDLLGCSDVVTICAPLTDATDRMFNLDAFTSMKRSAILINVTRGRIMDGPALIKALEDGLIAAAGLDVTPEEPLPADSPLWSMDNVIITPHTSGGSPARVDRLVELFCENLKKFRSGEALLSVIDKRKGY